MELLKLLKLLKLKLLKQGHTAFLLGRQCENRWKYMTKRYSKAGDHNSISLNNKVTCPYYREMRKLYRYCPNVQPVATYSSSGTGNMKRSIE